MAIIETSRNGAKQTASRLVTSKLYIKKRKGGDLPLQFKIVVVDVVERILLFGVFVFVSSLVVILLLFQTFCKLICINYNKLERFVAPGGKLCI